MVVDLAKIDVLFPTLVMTNDDSSKIITKTELHNVMRNFVHDVIDTASTLHDLG